MFWTQYRSDSPQLDILLNKEVLSLRELLEEECLFQGLKSPNQRLIDFLTRDDILQELVSLVTEEPSTDLNEKERYRLPHIACEILCARLKSVSEKLSEETYLTKLFSLLDREPPLNPLLASFFGRTVSSIALKHDQHWYPYQYTCLQVLEFLKSHNGCLNLLVKHFGTSSIMELTLALLNDTEGSELQKMLVNLVQSERLIEKVVSLFDSRVDEEVYYNSSYFLCETIKNYKKLISSDHNNPVIDYISHSLLTSSTVTNLLENVFKNELCESKIIGSIDVLLAIVKLPPGKFMNKRNEFNSETASGSQETGLDSSDEHSAILSSIAPFLPRLHSLLIDPPKPNRHLPNLTIKPFGKTRLSIVKFITNLVSTHTPGINSTLSELKTIRLLMDMFFQYPSNNFLHTQVVKLVTFAMDCDESQDSTLLKNIFVDCDLLNWILDGWKESTSLKETGQKRQHAYMGHLINLSNNILQRSQSRTLKNIITNLIEADTLMAWEDFLTTELIEINKINSRCLGGKHPLDDNEAKFQEPHLKLTRLLPDTKDDQMEVDFEISLPEEESPAKEELIFTRACTLKRAEGSSISDSSLAEESSCTRGSEDDDEDDDEGEENLWMDCSEPFAKDS